MYQGTRRLKRIRWTAAIFSVVMILGLWLLTLMHLRQAREMHSQSMERNLLSVTRAIHAHALRTIQQADQAALFIKREYKQTGSTVNLQELIDEKILSEDIFNLFTITNDRSDVIASTRPFEKVNLADREHIRVHIENKTNRLFVGRPVTGRVSGKASIQLTRRINDNKGEFAGVVIVSMNPFYFTDVYKSLGLTQSSVIGLVRNDGVVLVKRTANEEAIGVDISDSTVFKKMIEGEAKAFESGWPHDDVARLWAHQEIENTDLFVAVGVDQHEELKPYFEDRRQIVILAGILTVIIMAFALAITRLASKLENSRFQAILASQAKTRFLSNVSHELRTPLNSILGYGELLSLDERDPDKKIFLKNIMDSGAHLLSLVNSLLALVRIEKGEIELTLNREPLKPLLLEVIHAHQRIAIQKGLKLDLIIDSNVPAEIWCDRVKLLQIVHNLVNNAIKFTESGTVSVSVHFESQKLRIDVHDTGRGITAENLDTIFDRFVRLDHTNTRSDGFGIGLPIVKQLVKLMDGKVTVSSDPELGTTFSVIIPLEAWSDSDNAPHNSTGKA